MKTLLKAGAALMLGAATIAAPSFALAQDNVGSVNSVQDKRGYDALDAAQKSEYDAWPAENQTFYTGWPSDYQSEFWTYPADYRTSYWGWPADYRTAYWAWPSDSRTSYWTWPSDYQSYYWALTPEQQSAWWALSPEQRGQITAMTPEQQLAAWDSINAQITATQAAETKTIMASSTTVEATPAARTGEYPICGGAIQDSCIQPREAGKNYGNVPLDYWPGKPASSM
ncbi:hypothetical protein EKN06_01480 [Croceicoccus ponticola]|uniref:Uncharacterized protein n=1 Tax=Croceicoccus ponticola TaxID=2217664 RepID=A0A437H053_9SPHN|nr:hypothetical protein [Croceicoccus ponticola]RVQ68922.1 hypothetical protein EKN06_01480 [Croceicoccus ponticola]